VPDGEATQVRYTRPRAERAGTALLDAERLISLKEAAARFPISQSQLQLLARTGRLDAQKVGRDWLTTATAVAAYLANPELRSRDPHKYKRGC
jgi:excisionase family DNA binding protein